MRRVVINADDLGNDRGRNEGIVESIVHGPVRSVSLLANGAAFDDAVLRLGVLPDVSVGVHLNISTGRPLSGCPRSLVCPDGLFPGKEEARRRVLTGEADTDEILAEWEAQVARVLAAGIEPDHLDGHQHVHVLGVAASALIRLAVRTGIRRVRVPDEPGQALPGPVDRARILAGGLTTTDHFRGLAMVGRLDADLLAATLATIPQGTTEVMVHPGLPDPAGGPFSGPDRLREMDALVGPIVADAIESGRIEVASWKAVPCAS